MKSYSLYSDIEESFTFPSVFEAGSVLAKVIYEWGGEIDYSGIVENGQDATVSIAGDEISAAGRYHIRWSAVINDSVKHFDSGFLVEEKYVNQNDFFDLYEDLNISEYSGDLFNRAERLSRGIIDTFCGQNFQFIGNKTLSFDGNGREKMHLGKRISHLNSVKIERDNTEVAEMSSVEVDWNSRYSIRSSEKFTSNSRIIVNADWGWVSPPANIKLASSILTLDMLEDSRREHHSYGIIRMDQDTNRILFDSKIISESTGNIDVDVLLMDYVYWVPEWI